MFASAWFFSQNGSYSLTSSFFEPIHSVRGLRLPPRIAFTECMSVNVNLPFFLIKLCNQAAANQPLKN